MTARPAVARSFALAGLGLILSLLLTACGGDGSTAAKTNPTNSTNSTNSTNPTGTTAAGSHNNADSAFATDMIAHHAQAVEMSDILLGNDGIDRAVVQLAEAIKAAQSPEIEQMRGWLAGWGEPVPAQNGAMDDMGGMNHDMGAMPGMMSEEDMAMLDDATGADAQRMYLEQMVLHHQGAIVMSETELRDGVNADAKQLAGTIMTTQRSEITTMTELLAG